MSEQLYKVREVAELFDVTPGTIRIWLNEGTLRGIKIGKGHYWRVPASAVEELATSRWGSENEDD